MHQHVRRWQVLTTASIAVLSTVSSLLALFRPGHYADPALLLPRMLAQDTVILLVAVPVLVVGLRYAVRGSLRGRIVWLGALAFTTYIWASIAGQTAFNGFYLGYVALFSLSLFTLVGGVLGTDAAAVQRRLAGRVPTRLFVGWLALVAVGLSALWLSDALPAAINGTTPAVIQELGPRATQTYLLDLGVVVPALAVAARWLHRGEAWGYVASGVLLVMASILAPSITALTIVDAGSDSVTVTLPLFLGSVVPPVVSAAFAVRYLVALDGRESAPTATDEGVRA